MCTLYPYGLNKEITVMKKNVPLRKLFPTLPIHGESFLNVRTRSNKSNFSSYLQVSTFFFVKLPWSNGKV